MKALILSPRFPWPAWTGDRVRATLWISALARSADVTLIAPHGHIPADVSLTRFIAAPRSLARGIAGLARIAAESLPIQCLLAAPFDWRSAIDRARRDGGPFDVTIVLLARMHPWIRTAIDSPAILDAVDALGRNAAERAKAAGLATRPLWRVEQRRMARLEREAAAAYDRVVILADDERADFGDAIAVTNGIDSADHDETARAFDFGFWGRLPYFANADAVRWILDEIWPQIRALRPDATMIIGGADASRSLRNDARRHGVTLVSPIDDVAAFARTIRVALMPLRYGSGQSNKILEAAEAGCAIVGTPVALRGLAPLASLARVASSASDLARHAVHLVTNESERAVAAQSLRATVATAYARSGTLDRLRAIGETVAAR